MLSSLFRAAKPATPAVSSHQSTSGANHHHQNSTPTPPAAFLKLGLSDSVSRAAAALGYTEPTPIQLGAIPVVMSGRDLIGSAQTGTGKTAAFALPILTKLGSHQRGNAPRVLVLEPTRELALQVEKNFRDYAKGTDLRALAVYGGVGYGNQRDQLLRGTDVLVATPGRLVDYLQQGTISLRGVSILVLDEVDRMLDMGFLPVVKRIVEQCPSPRQTLFFSATLPPEIEKLTRWALKADPAIIEIGQRQSPAETVAHAFYPVAATQKIDLLIELLKQAGDGSTLVFTRTKHGADKVARKLQAARREAGVLHGNRSQGQRVRALDAFRDGSVPVLVATDIAARGLDVAGVTHVINFDVPRHAEDYVHRIGRTGRAKTEGDAYTLLSGPDDEQEARAIERFIGAKIERKRVPGFAYTQEPEYHAAPAAPRGQSNAPRRSSSSYGRTPAGVGGGGRSGRSSSYGRR